jgi:hypothetical protein
MRVHNLTLGTLLKDPTSFYNGKEILSYGEDNLYPQRAKLAALESPLVKSAVYLLADFMEGDGFTSPGTEALNSLGHLDSDLLRLASQDLALFNGFAFLVKLNGAGEKEGYYSIPFEQVRFEKPAKVNDPIKGVYLCADWSQEGINGIEAERYPLIMPGEDLNALNSPRGAVFYYTGLRQVYPLSKIDAVFDTAQANTETQIFQLSNIRNGFHSATIFKHFGEFESKKEENDYKEQLQELIGAENANSTFIIELDEDLRDAQLFEQLPANNNDTLFDSTIRNITSTILQHFNVPPSLMGVFSEGAVFTQDNILEDFKYMNLRTQNERRILERNFELLGINETPIIIKDPDINGNDQENEPINENGNNPPNPGATPGDPPAE